jgi:DNA-binding NtrC family response regulator
LKVDVRIVAATNKDLEEEVKKGKFREDLFYRLNVVNIIIPPLRERKEDILPLAHYFLKKFCNQNERNILRLNKEVEKILLKYSWPGNVRELENLMERLSILCETDEVKLDDLPPKIIENISDEDPIKNEINISKQFVYPTLKDLENLKLSLKEFLEEIENRLLIEALQKSGGVKNKAAQLLGIKRTTLVEKLKKKSLQ